jgi:hypothetical protein
LPLVNKVTTDIVVVRSSSVSEVNTEGPKVVTTNPKLSQASALYLASAHVDPEEPVIILDAKNCHTNPGDLVLPAFQSDQVVFGAFVTSVPAYDQAFWLDPGAVQNHKVIDLYDRPFEPEIAPTTPFAPWTDAWSVLTGAFFFSKWKVFVEAYVTELSEAISYRNDFAANLSILDVLKTADTLNLENPSYIPISYQYWKPCGTPIEYFRNKGFTV